MIVERGVKSNDNFLVENCDTENFGEVDKNFSHLAWYRDNFGFTFSFLKGSHYVYRNLLERVVPKSIRFDDTVLTVEKPSDWKYFITEQSYAREFLESVEKDSVVCDVGTYHGFYTLLGSLGEKVYGFEIDEENLERTCKNVELSDRENVSLHHKAVWGHNAEIEAQHGKGGKNQVGTGEIHVEAVTLDSFFEEREDPDILKMDIEGAEVYGLRGAEELFRRSRPKLFVELHPEFSDNFYGSHNSSVEQVIGFLKDCGYSIKSRERRGSEILVIAE